ncbi:gamma-glutamylcyclotransferase-like [Helicoverpa zea]|uniref:gamma-glutamylcyclotransferase-like n=1 Tax=Helicoverpa zea TaxID=7113 RepID=UPI001F595FDB|nr:gamma-glutamylcyclotransferase-like [Helicoverpa zea]
MIKSDIYKPDTFLYFAYAANLLKFQIRMHNPSAEFVSIARLDNYRLDFLKYSQFWGGPVGTLVPTANAHVWGVIWRLHKDDLENLDNQKDIDTRKFYVKYLEVLTPYMGTFRCRTYIQKVNPLPRGNRDIIPVERWPSWSYKQVILMGAREHGLPNHYIRFLRKLKDNGDEGCFRTSCLLTRYAKDVPCGCRVPGKILRKPLMIDLKRIREEKELPKVQPKPVPVKKPPKKKLQF